MRIMKPLRGALIVALALVGWSCSRAVTVGSNNATVYAIQVQNTLPQAMVVSFQDDAGTHQLGIAGPGHAERFVIARPSSTRIFIKAVDQGGMKSVGPIPVILEEGRTVQVTLR